MKYEFGTAAPDKRHLIGTTGVLWECFAFCHLVEQLIQNVEKKNVKAANQIFQQLTFVRPSSSPKP